MTHKGLIAAFSMLAAASPVSAAFPIAPGVGPAPVAPETARYCLRMEPITGTRIETIECRTRYEWAELDVNIDEEWAQNGVRILA
jgi:hypothetical protein